MNKKILSLFCSGLMLFANAPCCAALDASSPKLTDVKDMKDSDNKPRVPVSLKKDNSSGEPQQGVHMTIEQITLKLNKTLNSHGTFVDGSSYTVDLTSGDLTIPLSLAYIDDQETTEIKINFDLIDDNSLINSITNEEKKSQIISSLKKLKGLRFQIESSDTSNTDEYLDCYINDCDNNGNLDIRDTPNVSLDELSLQPMKSSDIDSTTGIGLDTQKLNLIISARSDATASLTDLILILSDLESTFDYRLQIQGAKA